MENSERDRLKMERHATNRFNDSEYKRWSERITATQSVKTQWGIETFLCPTENLLPGREDSSTSLIETDKNKKKAVNKYGLETN